jgi:AcrR family transcriptional regulator
VINPVRLKRSGLPPRFDKEAWLQAAIDVLANEGQAKLRVENLASKLGVTKGSFYHHFKNRKDFVLAILDYWLVVFTEKVNAEVGDSDIPARERLLLLMKLIDRDGLDRYDAAFRSWAAQDPIVTKFVKKVDLVRFEFVRSLFAEMGCEGDDLNERTRIWLVFHCAQRTVMLPGGSKSTQEVIAYRHDFFTRLNRDH